MADKSRLNDVVFRALFGVGAETSAASNMSVLATVARLKLSVFKIHIILAFLSDIWGHPLSIFGFRCTLGDIGLEAVYCTALTQILTSLSETNKR